VLLRFKSSRMALFDPQD